MEVAGEWPQAQRSELRPRGQCLPSSKSKHKPDQPQIQKSWELCSLAQCSHEPNSSMPGPVKASRATPVALASEATVPSAGAVSPHHTAAPEHQGGHVHTDYVLTSATPQG